MWAVDGVNLSMTEQDFGVALPAEFKDATLGASDELKFTFKNRMNGNTVLEKVFTSEDITENRFSLVFTEAESEKLPVGTYVYCVDWYTDGVFNYCIVESGLLRVGDKA